MNCPACGHALSPGARFCNKCGTLMSQSIPAVEPAPNIALSCAECGKPLKPDARFCIGCGTVVAALASESTPVVGAFSPLSAPLTPSEPSELLLQSSFESKAPDLKTPDFKAPDFKKPAFNFLDHDDTGFSDTQPHDVGRSHLDSLPLHPIQRGVPDFELPQPRQKAPSKVVESKPESLRTEEAVAFDGLDDFSTLDNQPSQGGGLKGLVIAAALAVVLIGAAGWFGYRHFSDTGTEAAADAVPAVAALPDASDVAEDENEVPTTAVQDSAQAQDAAKDAAADAPGADSVTSASDSATTVPVEASAVSVVPPAAATDVQAPPPVAAAQSDRPVPVTVAPVRVLKDAPGSSPARSDRSKAKKNLDSLLD